MEATAPQRNYIQSLFESRSHGFTEADLQAALADRAKASDMIDTLRGFARRGSEVAVTEPGMYRADDKIFKVQRSRSSDRLYAKELVHINGERLTEIDQVVKFEFRYDRGAIFKLKPEHRMSLEEAKAFGIRYGVCCVCGAWLSNATSVALGIGPVCGGRV